MPDTTPVCLVNLAPEPLKFTADSRQHTLQPGENWGYAIWQVPFAKAQNPVFGTEDYQTLDFKSFIAVKGVDDCTPYDKESYEISKLELERFNRAASGLHKGIPTPNRFAIKPGTRAPSSGAGGGAFAVGERG